MKPEWVNVEHHFEILLSTTKICETVTPRWKKRHWSISKQKAAEMCLKGDTLQTK